MTIEQAAVKVVTEISIRDGIQRKLWHVAYGDCYLLDEIGIMAEMKRCHPLDRHKRILDALDRSSLFEKRYFKARYGLARMFYLIPNEERAGGASE